MRYTVFVLVGYLLAGTLQSCSTDSDHPKNLGDTSQIIELTLADARQPVFALIYIAEAKGYFTDLGLKINYLEYTSGRDALNSVLKGKADVATVFETPVVIQAFHNKPIRILSTLHNSERNTGLVVRRDHGIESLQDLKGKKIAVPFNTNAHFFLNQFLSSESIMIDQLVNIKPEDSAQILYEGKIDAVAVWNPNLYKARTVLSEAQLNTYYSDLYSEMSMLVTLRDKLQESRQAYLRLLTAIKNAEFFLKNHPEQSMNIVVQHLARTSRPELVINVWNDFIAEAKLSNSLYGLLTQEARWMKENDIINNNELPNFHDYIDSSLLLEIDASAVTLVN